MSTCLFSLLRETRLTRANDLVERTTSLTPPLSNIQFGFPEIPEQSGSICSILIRHWLNDCDANHSCMRKTGLVTRSRLPRWLLDVGGASPQDIRLQSTIRMSPETCYVALSFVRGDMPMACPQHMHNFEHSIHFKALPRTFQNAITIVRQLGLRYLWIDSLCIIQGPCGELLEEAVNMENIFSNATFVLAACTSLGVAEGFLGPQRQRMVVPMESRKGGSIFLCEFIDDFERDVEHSPLAARGWVLQERIFARRTVYFTSTQLYLQCNEGIRCSTLACMIK